MNATPQRLKLMTKEQLIACVPPNEEALDKAQAAIAAAIAAAVQAEREAILDFADKSETHYNAYGELLDFIRARNEVKA